MPTTPSTVRFREPTASKLRAFLEKNPSLSIPDVANFALELLMQEIDAGASIGHGTHGMSLIPPLRALPHKGKAPQAAITGAIRQPRAEGQGAKRA